MKKYLAMFYVPSRKFYALACTLIILALCELWTEKTEDGHEDELNDENNIGNFKNRRLVGTVGSQLSTECPQNYRPATLDNKIYCYFINPQNRTCPYYPNVSFKRIYEIPSLEDYFRLGQVWAPLRRKDDMYDRPFIWTEPTYMYGQTEEHVNKKDNVDYECVIYNKTGLEAEDCSKQHLTLCVSEFFEPSEDRCVSMYRNQWCFTGNYEGNICYCLKITSSLVNRNREDLCLKLAEPKESYQNNILKEILKYSSLSCWIGLEKRNGNFLWMSSDVALSYEGWAPDADKSKNFGAIQFSGWTSLEVDNALRCGICENKVPLLETSFWLYFNQERNEIEMFIKNPTVIYQNRIHCFYEMSKFLVVNTNYHENAYVTKTPETEYPTVYWCQFFKIPTMEIVASNEIVAFDKESNYTHEFAMKIKVVAGNRPPVSITDLKDTSKMLVNVFKETGFKIRPIKIINYEIEAREVTALYHITNFGANPLPVIENILEISEILRGALSINSPIFVVALQSAEVCPESSELYHGYVLTFPVTRIGSWATPAQICLQTDYSPVMRQCIGNFTEGGFWGEIQGECSQVPVTSTTSKLNQLLNSNYDDATLNHDVNEITETFQQDARTIDVHLTSQILSKVTLGEKFNKTVFINTINNVMAVNRSTLSSSQKRLNSTDRLLYNIDKLLLGTSCFNIYSPHLIIQCVKSSNKTVGVMVIDENKNNDFTDFRMVPLYQLNYTQELSEKNFEIAVKIPRRLVPGDHYFVSLFKNDNLFNEESPNEKIIGSWIVSILIPTVTKFINMTIEVYFKEFKEYSPTKECVHWLFGNDKFNLPISGKWIRDFKPVKLKSSIHMCAANHTTHFGLLVKDFDTFSDSDNFWLDLISLLGSILSAIGVTIILLTALFFKNWRNNPNNQIVVNVAICLILLIILMFLAGRLEGGPVCVTVGACLHYMMLSKFCWMVIICYSTYRRLVLNLHYHIDNVVLKYCLIAWGSPLLVVTTFLIIAPDTYDRKEPEDLCHPKRIYLQLGIVVPLTAMVINNAIMYVIIIIKINTTRDNLRKHTLRRSYSVHKSLILLFFLMGLTWGFALLTSYTNSLIFAFIFCITNGLHGFVMFAYYILDFTNTRQMWNAKLKQIWGGRKRIRKGSNRNLVDPESDITSQISVKTNNGRIGLGESRNVLRE